MAQRKSQSNHDQMVTAVAEYWNAEGKTVQADIAGYNCPEQIGDHIPDVEVDEWINRSGSI